MYKLTKKQPYKINTMWYRLSLWAPRFLKGQPEFVKKSLSFLFHAYHILLIYQIKKETAELLSNQTFTMVAQQVMPHNLP